MLTARLEVYPENIDARSLLARAYAALRDQASAQAEMARIVEVPRRFERLAPHALVGLAVSHAVVGDTDRALELLRLTLRRGSFDAITQARVVLEAGPVSQTPAFQAFFADYESAQQRLREIY